MKSKIIIFAALLTLLLFSCEKRYLHEETKTADWTVETHSKDAPINYNIVFPQDKVNKLELTFSTKDWQTIQSEMIKKVGPFGQLNSITSTIDNNYAPCSVKFNDKEWLNVGIKYKGNLSLKKQWIKGIHKLSFKLNFDKYEDDYPEIKNQRFYGFKELTLFNNYKDKSYIKEMFMANILAEENQIASKAAFYELYINTGDGNGLKYYGLYTMLENIDNTVIKSNFDNNDGNLYEPEGATATFASKNINTSDFPEKNNDGNTDWNDIKTLNTILHADYRSSTPSKWRSDLEEQFNVSNFLKTLALNRVVENKETYGFVAENFYLYNNNNRLEWIATDFNEIIKTKNSFVELSLDDISDDWPLISFLIEDAEYKKQYHTYLKNIMNNNYNTESINNKLLTYREIINISVNKEDFSNKYSILDSESEFVEEFNNLKSRCLTRCSQLTDFLIDK